MKHETWGAVAIVAVVGIIAHGLLAIAANPPFLTNPVTPITYPYLPLSPGQHNVAPTSATKLTVPIGAAYATVCATTATVKYTTDGTTAPTSGVGMPLLAGSCMSLAGSLVLANFNAISSTGTLDVEYFQ